MANKNNDGEGAGKYKKRTVTPGTKHVIKSKQTKSTASLKSTATPKQTPLPSSRKVAGDKPQKDKDIKFVVHGQVLYSDKKPVIDVKVIAFDQDIAREDLLGEAITDQDGNYQITYSESQFCRTEKEIGGPDLIVRVYSAEGKVMAQSKRKRNAGREETVDLTVGNEQQFVVSGTIYGSENRPRAGALVRAYDQDLRKKQLLGKATTDAAGHYRIAYTSRKFLRAEKTSADLYVVVLNAQHKDLVSSEVLFNAPSEVVVDLTLPPDGQTLSEFEILLADILPLFKGQGKDDAELKISELEDKDIAFLSRESGQPQERIAFLLAAVKAALASPSSSGVKVKRYVSKAQNDTGEFEFSFRDGPYNPFEGAGAISSWKLSLPKNFRSFDYQTIGDVILHIDYTTEDAGEGSSFRQIVEATTSATLGALLNYFSNKPLFRVFSLRHEFPNEFHRLLHSPINTEISIKLSEKFFPIFSLGRTMQISLAKLALGTPKNQTVRNFKISINNSERTSFTSDPLLGGLPTNQNLEALFVAGNRTELKFKLKNAGNLAPTPPVIGDSSPISPDKLLDMLIYLEYKITS